MWEDFVLHNRSLRIQNQQFKDSCHELSNTIAVNKEQFAAKRNQDMMDTDRVMGRLKTKLGKIEQLWIVERDRAKRLDRQHALDCSIVEEQKKQMQARQHENDTLVKACAEQEQQLREMRLKLGAMEQRDKNRGGTAPSLRLIVKAVMESNDV